MGDCAREYRAMSTTTAIRSSTANELKNREEKITAEEQQRRADHLPRRKAANSIHLARTSTQPSLNRQRINLSALTSSFQTSSFTPSHSISQPLHTFFSPSST